MITGELKNQIDQVWDHLWTNGLSNPLDAIEQITFLLFLKRLDEQELAREASATRQKKPVDKPLFKKSDEGIGGQLCRWSRFKQLDPATMYKVVSTAAFPFLKALGGADSSYTAHMIDATFKIPERGAVLSMPSGVFKPYAGVSTAVLVFTNTNSGGTDHVWFYDMDADGQSLDDKRTPLLPEDKLGPAPLVTLSPDEHAKNNLPDVVTRWRSFHPLPPGEGRGEGGGGEGGPRLDAASELKRPRTAQSFCVPKADLVAQGYDLSINRYKEVVHEEVSHRSPREILKELAKIETEIQAGMRELEGMLKS